MPLIERIVRGRAAVIDPAEAVARQVQRVLQEQELEAPTGQMARYTFYSTGDIQSLQALVERLTLATNRDTIRRYLHMKPLRLSLAG
jgi:glutamate racemase